MKSVLRTCNSRKAALFVAFLFFIQYSPQILKAQDSTNTHIFKGLWVVRNEMTDSASVDTMIHFAQKNGFNNIMVQVRGRGYAYYNSSLVQKAPYIKDKVFDPLKYAVTQGHKAGLKVHAWLNIYVLWSASGKPREKNHILNTHPEWTESDVNGVRDIDRMWHNKSSRGFFAGIFLAPTNPKVNIYLLNVIEEIVNSYLVDGIHLDYIRYQDSTYGYNPAGRNAFKIRYGIDPIDLPDLGEESRYKIYLKAWDRYRRNRVTALVKEAKSFCEMRHILLSAAVKPNMARARNQYLQDWERWLIDGDIDFVIPMNYTKSLAQFMANFHETLDNLPPNKIVMGIAAYNQSQYSVAEKILKTLSADYKGYCLFSYNTFVEEPTFIEPLKRYIRLK